MPPRMLAPSQHALTGARERSLWKRPRSPEGRSMSAHTTIALAFSDWSVLMGGSSVGSSRSGTVAVQAAEMGTERSTRGSVFEAARQIATDQVVPLDPVDHPGRRANTTGLNQVGLSFVPDATALRAETPMIVMKLNARASASRNRSFRRSFGPRTIVPRSLISILRSQWRRLRLRCLTTMSLRPLRSDRSLGSLFEPTVTANLESAFVPRG